MKQFIGAGVLLVVAASSAVAQDTKIYSTPTLPSREVLERLNLRMAWHTNVPMDGRRDGFLSVTNDSGQIIATTRSGVVAAYDAETGRELWKTGVGKASDGSYAPTFNGRSVLFVRGAQLYAIDRNTGRLQWQYRLPFGLSAAPVADDRQVYLSGLNGQVAAFQLPALGDAGASGTKGREPSLRADEPKATPYPKDSGSLNPTDLQPVAAWRASTNMQLDYAPAMTRDAVFYATRDGYLEALGKYPIGEQAGEIYRVSLDRRVVAPPAIYENMAYIPASDMNLHAVDMANGKTRWRYSPGGEINRTPFVTNEDVYVTAERKGLIRLKRETGEAQWKLPLGRTTTEAAPEVERVLAVNNKFVYAADRAGRLLVLDRATGKQLSYYTPFRDFSYPVANDTTDRLLLAANNGLIVCLHDREYEKPLAHRKLDYDRRPTENRIKALKDKLARKVTEKAVDALPLAEVIDSFRRKYALDIVLSDKVFTDAGLPPIRDKSVLQPRVESQEVGEVLKGILTQVGANYDIAGDVVVVLPAKKVAVANPAENVNPNPLDNVDPKVKAILATKVDPPAVEKSPVSEIILETYGLRFNDIKWAADEKAFKTAGLDWQEVAKKEVTHPKGKGLPLSQVLRDILAQVQATYEVRGDTIFIVPAKK